MSDEISIPERHREICKAIARTAREQGLSEFTGTYKPTHKDDWHGEITFFWKEGRHGEDRDTINIRSQTYVHTTIDDPRGDRR